MSQSGIVRNTQSNLGGLQAHMGSSGKRCLGIAGAGICSGALEELLRVVARAGRASSRAE